MDQPPATLPAPRPFCAFSVSSDLPLLEQGLEGLVTALSLVAILPATSNAPVRTLPFACISTALPQGRTRRPGTFTAALQTSVAKAISGRRAAGEQEQSWSWLRSASEGAWSSLCRPRGQFASISLTASSQSSSSDQVVEIPDAEELFTLAMSHAQVAEKLASVPVYTVVNAQKEFVLVSGGDENSTKHLGLFCFAEKDAQALLRQVKDREPQLGKGAAVVSVSLDRVYELNQDGIAFRFLPEATQVKHALDLRARYGGNAREFDGVPVFQTQHLQLRANNKRYLPLFLRQEDLLKALAKARSKHARTSPQLAEGERTIEVGSLEDCLRRMEVADAQSEWGDIVLIPPGEDVHAKIDERAQANSGGTRPTALC